MSLIQRALGLLGGRGGSSLAVGDPAPSFALTSSDGGVVSLKDVLAEGPAVLAFYPAAFTTGCTRELRRYAERQEELTARGGRLLAISVDEPATLARFKESLGARFTFLSDPGGAVSSLYGGLTAGKASRITVTVGQDGKITRITAGLPAIFPDGDIAACPAVPGRA